MRILLAEDDRPLGQAVVQALQDAAFAVDWVQDGSSAVQALETGNHDVLLLDLGLPRMDGFSVLQGLRAKKMSLPVIIITARDAVADRIQGLDFGADDYLVKPFSMDELQARIRAVTRRHHGVAQPCLETAALRLNPATHEVTYQGQTQPLTAREYALLHALMRRPGHILSREALEETLYGWNEEIASNSVEFMIHGLRKKLDKTVIKNVRGLGWLVSA